METVNIGRVVQVKDGIVFASGLSQAGYNQMVNIVTKDSEVKGLVLNLEKENVGIIVLGDYTKVHEGDMVQFTGEDLAVVVDEKLLGEVINPLGNSLYGEQKPVVLKGEKMLLERVAAGVISRKDVSRPLLTGIVAIDSMIPIGRGQRQLIIGDKKTGKTSICIDTIINQKGKNVICIYVAIGQKANKIVHMKEVLESFGAMEYTIIVTADASSPASLQYLAPYSGCAVAEYFAKQGKDVLVIYDDLSKHANAYREISLLLNRPPGREAYPGDIFYLHSRLLERALQYSDKLGGGSITALPIIETQAGDISAYIPTNVISITDGQIFLDTEIFNSGQRPAINIGSSVSRVGSSAQIKPIKQVAGQLKLDLAQFRELQAFSQFGAELDSATAQKLKKGEIISALLNQPELKPVPIANQIVVLYAAVHDKLSSISVSNLGNWQEEFIDFITKEDKEILELLTAGKAIEGDLEEKLAKNIDKFNKKYY